MDSDGGGVATAVTSGRLTSHHSTLRDTFIAADLSDAINREFSHNSSIVNSTTSPRRVSNVTLGAVLNSDRKSPPPANIVVRTLLEVIHNDETLTPRSAGGSPNGKKTWKSFKDRLKLKRNQNFSQNQNPNSRNWTSSLPVPQSDVIPSSRSSLGEVMANRNSLRSSSLRRVDTVPADDLTLREVDSGGSPRGGSSFRLSAALAAEREQTRRRLSRELDEVICLVDDLFQSIICEMCKHQHQLKFRFNRRYVWHLRNPGNLLTNMIIYSNITSGVALFYELVILPFAAFGGGCPLWTCGSKIRIVA
uniref:Uncharacterized protein n=1 Tax=Chenopodium quinoa TaxID=63459 RepID=A0A803KPZ4_CHEQI